MGECFYRLDQMIRESIEKGKEVAIFPMGKIGLEAKNILNNRYFMDGIYIDNNMCKFSDRVISLEQIGQYDLNKIQILLCVLDKNLNNRLEQDIKRLYPNADVANLYGNYNIISKEDDHAYFLKIKELVKIKKVLGYELVRIGRDYDGGYVFLDDFERTSLAYSFGISDDVSCDMGLAERGIEVWCFDHTIDYLPQYKKGLHFIKNGIAGKDMESEKLLSIETILKNNNHLNSKDIILKMDVEGAEYDFIQTISTEVINKFSQMTFEFHEILSLPKEKILSTFEKINRTHQAIWCHANNCGDVGMAKDILMPNLLEITFVRKDIYQFEDLIYSAPINIDMPNIEFKKDVPLIGW